MPKLRKNQGGKQEKKAIHPYSRKAAQLAREAHKQEKKEKNKLSSMRGGPKTGGNVFSISPA